MFFNQPLAQKQISGYVAFCLLCIVGVFAWLGVNLIVSACLVIVILAVKATRLKITGVIKFKGGSKISAG